jgi:hypothetical protein
MDFVGVLGRILAVLFAAILSYILYQVATRAYAQYYNQDAPPWRPRPFGGYNRIPRMREEDVVDPDEDEGYHDGESFDMERSSLLGLQKPLPERPLPDKPLPPVPGKD